MPGHSTVADAHDGRIGLMATLDQPGERCVSCFRPIRASLARGEAWASACGFRRSPGWGDHVHSGVGHARRMAEIKVNAGNFAIAETHRMMADLQRDAGGVNQLVHSREPAAIDKQTV